MRICLCGCGAVGSWLALFLSDPEYTFILIDDDRIGDENIDTSAYYVHQTGTMKAITLAEMLYRKNRCIAEPVVQTLRTSARIRRATADLVLDTFDNVAARTLTCGLSIPTLHAGVSEARTGEVMWDADYVLPEPSGYERGENPVCTHVLGRRILRTTAAIAASAVEIWLTTGEQHNFILTEGMGITRV